MKSFKVCRLFFCIIYMVVLPMKTLLRWPCQKIPACQNSIYRLCTHCLPNNFSLSQHEQAESCAAARVPLLWFNKQRVNTLQGNQSSKQDSVLYLDFPEMTDYMLI